MLLTFIIAAVIIIFIILYRSKVGEQTYEFVSLQAKKTYSKVAPYTYKEISKKIKELEKEKKLIEKYIDSKDFVITLEIEGNMLNSVELAKKINNTFNTHSTITFIIGGSYGLHEAIKERSNYKLSFSKLTFPHQLFRVNLLEQIYRSFKINNNEAYHK